MNIKRTVISCLFAASAALSVSAVTLQVDQARQRYPWNGLVDIDYTLTLEQGETFGADDNLEVLMIDKDVTPAVTNRAITFLQAPLPMTAGKHRITWNANADGVKVRTDKAEFRVEIAHYSEAYMIIDVSGGTAASFYPTTFVNRPPAGGFNQGEYKTNNIVLRRIHPGSYMAGSPAGEYGRTDTREKQHRVTLSKAFYIGVFEVTQGQYAKVMNANPSQKKGEDRPVETVTYAEARSFTSQLAAKCRSMDKNGDYTVAVTGFDLPTEFQWEYACRAGTTGALYTTNEYANTKEGLMAEVDKLGRYAPTRGDGRGNPSYTDHTVVGCYEPNAWGLYDMYGNVWEWCYDWFTEDAAALEQYVDPHGPASSSSNDHVIRGAGCATPVASCRSAAREKAGHKDDEAYYARGFRLCRTMP